MNITLLVIACLAVVFAWWVVRQANADRHRLALDREAVEAERVRLLHDRDQANAAVAAERERLAALAENVRGQVDLSHLTVGELAAEIVSRREHGAYAGVVRVMPDRTPPGVPVRQGMIWHWSSGCICDMPGFLSHMAAALDAARRARGGGA